MHETLIDITSGLAGTFKNIFQVLKCGAIPLTKRKAHMNGLWSRLVRLSASSNTAAGRHTRAAFECQPLRGL